MSGGRTNRKISAASARSHTRNTKKKSSSGVLKTVLLVAFVGVAGWLYQATQPPPPKPISSTAGVTAPPRIKLRDGRHLAYKEHGVPRNEANFKIVYVHGFDSCRHDNYFADALSPGMVEGMGIYMVSFDRPGYGESDPDPNRTPRSIALDIEELADGLGLGSKFYVLGLSMGAQITWTCLNYIPHRLAGATLVAPVINYWWRNLPENMAKEGFTQMLPADQWALRVAHYAPWLTFWWNTQKWFPISNVIAGNPDILSRQDKEILTKLGFSKPNQAYARQQGEYESLHRDMIVGFGSWEFDPLDIKDPFPNRVGSVHVWHGDEDRFVPVKIQRHIAENLPWIQYHEVAGSGHFLPLVDGMVDKIVKTLLVGEED
ncbi:PREDICTED: uncharacterized protein LOC104798959 [Tarenaya hassleriana]|uniref:uncharacterized protein LOC104798959 n=1 Tax=Tarenaya hassleriana TaxID=28532 RepID=UPI00053C7C91|nr:PREDICTED: uncharacterized protein LOC104798959 [Tarenaya hassleriana]